jgi:FtsX-like permease family protein/MacB-like protein
MADATKTTRFRFWLWLIRVVGVIVPRRLRTDWRQEWEAELRHREALLAEWERLNRRHKLDLLRRSTSAFWDALWLQQKRWEGEMFQDLRFGVRMLLKNPGFTLITIFTLGLGIGANTAIFSVVNAVLLRPLPGFETDRLVIIWQKTIESDSNDVGSEAVKAWRQRAQSFEQIEAGTSASYTVAGDLPESLQATLITTGYFSLYRVRAASGRLFLPGEDSVGRDRVAVLDHDYWQRRFRGDPQIVGVVGDIKQTAVTDEGKMELFVPYGQNGVRFTMMAVRTTGDPMMLIPAIRREVAREDKDLPIADVKTMEERVSWLTAQSQTSVMLFGIFAALALLLAAIGIYGVMAYAVTQRTHEIGIRMALGAQARDVFGLVIRHGVRLTLVGAMIGLIVSFALIQVMKSLLFEVGAIDPLTFGGVALLLGLVAFLACYLPARKATEVDPLLALRSE